MSLREHVSLREHACVSSRGAQSTELVSLYIGYWTLNNYYYYYVTHNINIITNTVIQQFISLGITQVKLLCEMKSYEPQFRSKRIFESLKREITATSSPQHWNDMLHTSSRWETDSVIKHVTDIEISCEKFKLVSLRNPPKKGLCLLLIIGFLMMITILEYGVTS